MSLTPERTMFLFDSLPPHVLSKETVLGRIMPHVSFDYESRQLAVDWASPPGSATPTLFGVEFTPIEDCEPSPTSDTFEQARDRVVGDIIAAFMYGDTAEPAAAPALLPKPAVFVSPFERVHRRIIRKACSDFPHV